MDLRRQGIRVGDSGLHYMLRGIGEPVVFVHGGLGDLRQWTSQLAALSSRFKVISYSRRGYYPNEKVVHPFTIVSHSRDLSSLISQLSSIPVHLVGDSIGAYVATHCALQNPEMVKSLVVSEPPITPLLRDSETDLAMLRQFETEAIEPALRHYSAGRPEDAARIIIGYLEGNTEVYDSLPEEEKAIIRTNSPATYAELDGGFEGITRDQVKQIRPPLLLMKSEFGPKALRRVGDSLHEIMPNASLKQIKNTSHGSITQSADYLSAVTEFLAQSK